ncbi:hypothetical protein PAXINDRAFT_162817 [Paxillus involutus ATCC 200175]|uniref:DDE-1 domain-containing protein n=1 Tax=Paxillus involutus ATCC 200175 TaxID=664439 RepID=A0A0C9SZZ6_PAXIN|nr:hypothetical protein PAXINDRAFT_162817 [Paxillus involutus ATCC 200175]
MGDRGFPLSHRQLKEHVDEICHAYHINVSRSRALETKCGRAVNLTTNEAWWNLLKDTITKYNIKQHNTYGVDEMDCQPSGGEREHVFGRQKKTPQYQQCGGSRENITVIVTICADGMATAPSVIFKGSAFQVKWNQENPVNASLGYSKKGWTDGEIGVKWIKNFDKETAAKANDEYQLLLVDGHNSHYTRGFLEHARTHQILVLCYPSHITHIYQGLDVVVSSTLKCRKKL